MAASTDDDNPLPELSSEQAGILERMLRSRDATAMAALQDQFS